MNENCVSNEVINEVIACAIQDVNNEIEKIKEDPSSNKPCYKKISEKRIELLNQMIRNWFDFKIFLSEGDTVQANMMLKCNKLLSKYENELGYYVSYHNVGIVSLDNIEKYIDGFYSRTVTKYEKELQKLSNEDLENSNKSQEYNQK